MNNILLDAENWKYVTRDDHPLIKVKCQKCGSWGDLIDHTVSDDGIINPSVICGEDNCDWHVMAALKDFKRREA